MILASVIAAAVLTMQPVGTTTSGPAVQAVSTNQDLKGLSLDQLIDRLPVVGKEWNPEERTYDPCSTEMKRRLEYGAQLTAEQWKRALTRTEALVMRPKWLAGTAFIVPMQQPWWLHVCEVTLTPSERGPSTLRGGTLVQETCGNGIAWREREQLHQELGTFPAGKRTFTFKVRIERGQSWAEPLVGKREVWSGRFSFDVEFVNTLDEVLPPVKGPAIDEALRSSMGACVASNWGKDSKSVSNLVLDLDTKAHPELKNVAVRMRVEALRDNEVRSTVEIGLSRNDRVLNSNSVYKDGEPLFTFATLNGLDPAVRHDKAELARWTIRVSAIDKDVLSLWHVKSRWVGSFELPLAKAFEMEDDRTKGTQRIFCWMP